jgi:hypothetical protein
MALSIPIISDFNAKGIDKAIREFKKLETTGEKAQFAISKAAVPAGLAVVALGGFLVNAAKGAEEARQANQRLGNVLDSMGYAGATERVANYAESLEKSLAVDADVIKATQTKLATFGKLTASVDEAGGAFDRATLAALDMAAAGFGSAEGNAVQLGKALEDPIKGITALAKSGVTFTEQEKEKIKTLVESGNLLEAQNMILAAVEKQVGGTAASSASSFDKMKFALAGISDTFGELVLPHIDKFSKTLAKASNFVQKNQKLVGILVLTFGGLATGIVAVNVAMKIWSATTKAFTAIQAAFNAVMALNPIFLIVAAVVAIIAVLVVLQKEFGIFDGVIRVVGDAFKKVWEVIKTVFDWVTDNWKLLLIVFTGPFGLFVAFVATFKDQIIGFMKGVIGWITDNWKLLLAIFTGPFGLFIAFVVTFKDQIIGLIRGVFDWAKNNWPLLLAILTGPFGLAILGVVTFRDQIMNMFSLIYNGIKATMGFVADVITAPFKAAFRAVASLWNNSVGKLSFTMPDIPGLPGRGKTFSMPKIEMLAEGGIVTSPTLAMIGEGRGPEAVIPLSKLGSMGFGGGGGSITVNVTSADPNEVVRALQAYNRNVGRLPVTVQ